MDLSTVTLLYIKYILKLSKLIILDGKATTQVFKSIEKKDSFLINGLIMV
jgi:hypothetical protein